MAFSMHCWKKFNLTIWLLAAFLLPGAVGNAQAEGVEVRSAELVASEETWQLNADFGINFNAEMEEALNKGVPLNFLIEFELMEARHYWFDDEVVSASKLVRLSYHALSRQFLINTDSHQKSFATLQDAVEELEKLRAWAVLDKSQVKKGETYYAILRMRLDRSRLPKQLQVDPLGSEKWNLISERYRWTPVLTSTESAASPAK